MPKITIAGALKNMWKFMISEDKPAEEKKDDLLYCRACKHPMTVKSQARGDFMTNIIYICSNCDAVVEQHFDNISGKMTKEIFVANNIDDSEVSQIEIFNLIDHNKFDLSRLWSVSGALCYPVLMWSQFTNTTTLLFVDCTNDIRNGEVDAFMLSEHRILCNVHIARNQEMSYFCNPYLLNIPHTGFGFVSFPTEINDLIECVDRVRYRHRVYENDNSLKVHEITIIEDFPIMAFGIELYLRIFDSGKDEASLKDICNSIHLTDMIRDNKTDNIDERYSIHSVRMHQINLFSYKTNNIKTEIKEEFAKDVSKFLEYLD